MCFRFACALISITNYSIAKPVGAKNLHPCAGVCSNVSAATNAIVMKTLWTYRVRLKALLKEEEDEEEEEEEEGEGGGGGGGREEGRRRGMRRRRRTKQFKRVRLS